MSRPAALAFLDTETTALDEDHGRIWEIGAILRGPHQDEDLQVLMHIEGVLASEFEPKALTIGKFEARYGMDGPRVAERDVAMAFHSYLGGRHLVGANPAFDQAFLKSLFRRHGLETSWHHRLIDVEVLAMQELGIPTPMGLRQSADALGIQYVAADLHGAYPDAELAMKIYDLVVHGTEQGRN